MKIVIAAAFAALVAWSVSAFTAGCSSFCGMWVFEEGSTRMVILIDETPRGLHYVSTTWQSSNQTGHAEFTAGLDEVPALVIGNRGMLAPVILHLVDDVTIEASYIVGLRPVAHSRWSLSGAHETLTVVTASHDANGLEQTKTLVFRRSHS